MPNKFMQAGYGQPARKFLLEQNLVDIVDFGDNQVFDEATTYPCILTTIKDKPQTKFHTSIIQSPLFRIDFPSYIQSIKSEIAHASLSSETWVISNSADQNLLEKIVSKSECLEDFIKGTSKRGILTGLTEAFIVPQKVYEWIHISDPKSALMLKPFLQGRDIKPYSNPEVKSWLILVPKGYSIKRNLPISDPNHLSEPTPRYGDMPEESAWGWFKRTYKGIAEHLLPFQTKAESRGDKGDFWWELRACDYYDEFAKPKIMYQKFQVRPCFIYDEEGLFCNDSMWIIPTADKVLLGILNSKLGWWLISKYCSAIQNGYQLIWNYFGKIPIIRGEEPIREQITKLVNQIISEKKSTPEFDTSGMQLQIDQLVYELYGLTEEEIKIVEGQN